MYMQVVNKDNQKIRGRGISELDPRMPDLEFLSFRLPASIARFGFESTDGPASFYNNIPYEGIADMLDKNTIKILV